MVKEGRKNKRHHAHIAEDDELAFKKEREEDSSEEYVLVAALTNSVNYGGMKLGWWIAVPPGT